MDDKRWFGLELSGDGVSLDADAPKTLLSIGLVDDLSRLSRKGHDQEHLSDHVMARWCQQAFAVLGLSA
jgi:hypothetical protein